MNITAAIRAELAWHKWTLTDLSDKTGIAQATLSKKMNGHSEFKLNELDLIADALDLPLASLITKAEVAPC